MTRVNVVPVEELTNPHLSCEHYELIRVYRLVEDAIERGEKPDDWRNPDTYRMGAGHVRFFYPRLAYIRRREIQLQVEMLYRGLPLVREEYELSRIPPEWFGDFSPGPDDELINRQRLTERILEMERRYTRGYFID